MFKLEAPDSRFNLARIELARQFNWKKVATLNVALDYFSAVSTISNSDDELQFRGWLYSKFSFGEPKL